MYQPGKSYTYFKRNAVYQGMKKVVYKKALQPFYQFELENGCELLIDYHHTYLIKEKGNGY